MVGMFTGLENENRAREFRVTIQVGKDTTGFDIAEALRDIAVLIEDRKPIAGSLSSFAVAGEKGAGLWAFEKGVRD
jgi:hypothetical protein